MRDFYVTFLDCDNTARLFTVEVAMSNDATVDDAKKYFYSQAGVPAPNGKELRALVFSVYDVQDIEDALRNRRQIPIEIQRYLGDFSFDESPESKLEPEGEQYTTRRYSEIS